MQCAFESVQHVEPPFAAVRAAGIFQIMFLLFLDNYRLNFLSLQQDWMFNLLLTYMFKSWHKLSIGLWPGYSNMKIIW